jgi:hypothetical protein
MKYTEAGIKTGTRKDKKQIQCRTIDGKSGSPTEQDPDY